MFLEPSRYADRMNCIGPSEAALQTELLRSSVSPSTPGGRHRLHDPGRSVEDSERHPLSPLEFQFRSPEAIRAVKPVSSQALRLSVRVSMHGERHCLHDAGRSENSERYPSSRLNFQFQSRKEVAASSQSRYCDTGWWL